MRISRTVLLLGTALTFTAAPALAEDLNIGFIAPMTGGFAQVGKDMVDGFQLYLDEVNSDFAGAKVKLIVEDDQAKTDLGVTKACLLYTSPSPRDGLLSRMPSSA